MVVRERREQARGEVELAHLGFCTCSECATGGLCDRGFTCGDAEVEGVCVQPPGSCDTDGPGDRGWLCGGSLEPSGRTTASA
ncbi:MAG: hypothetical protein M5U28_15095 [Sandaracinaceae bacterium]|nr:hypothetical protein [Sandaracinaceae bacterium]